MPAQAVISNATLADAAPDVQATFQRLVEQFVLDCDQERDTLNRVSAWLDDIGPRLCSSP